MPAFSPNSCPHLMTTEWYNGHQITQGVGLSSGYSPLSKFGDLMPTNAPFHFQTQRAPCSLLMPHGWCVIFRKNELSAYHVPHAVSTSIYHLIESYHLHLGSLNNKPRSKIRKPVVSLGGDLRITVQQQGSEVRKVLQGVIPEGSPLLHATGAQAHWGSPGDVTKHSSGLSRLETGKLLSLVDCGSLDIDSLVSPSFTQPRRTQQDWKYQEAEAVRGSMHR